MDDNGPSTTRSSLLFRRAYEAVILVFLTPIGTLLFFVVAAGVLAVWGVGSPTLWWTAAAIAAPFLAVDVFLLFWRRRTASDLRTIARTITDAVWGEKGRA
jgi:membrane protein implicated in regulation of membrane protease activity